MHSLQCEGGLNSGHLPFMTQVCQISYKCKKYHLVHQIKQISTENFDLTLVYTVSQLTLSMDIFYGLHDGYDALVGASHREDNKETNKLEAENLKDIELKLKRINRSAVDEKLKNIRRTKG